jgi:hypothetical protein
MSLAHQNQQYQDLLTRIACTIFISSPHSHSEEPDEWQTVNLIWKKYSRTKVKQVVDLTTVTLLAKDCRSFEHAFERVPILSVYETAPTRTGSRLTSASAIVCCTQPCTQYH